MKKLRNYVKFIQGINPTVVRKYQSSNDIIYYDHASFKADYDWEEIISDKEINNNDELSLLEGDVIINNATQLAAIVQKANAGKIPSLNFTKVDFLNKGLDKKYFVWLFNEYSEVQRQKQKEIQGNGLITRIPIKSLSNIKIPIIAIEEQHKIGKAYIESKKLRNKLIKSTQLIEQFTNSILENNFKEKKL